MRSTTHHQDDGRRSVVVDLGIDPNSVRLLETPYGLIVQLEAFATAGELGGPGLPSKIIRVALPANTEADEVRWEVKASEALAREPVLIAPIQLPQPGVDDELSHRQQPPGEGGEPGRPADLRPSSTTIIDQPLVEPLPRPLFVSPIPELYRREAETPRPPAQLVTTEQIGLTPIAVIQINPVAYDNDGSLHLITDLEITIEHRPAAKQLEPPERITSRAQAVRLVEMAQMLVLNPDAVWDIAPLYPELITDIDYLIVTDDQRWDAETIAPAGAAGNLTAEFERLADWKRRRGLRARVVTITDIVAGRYGNLTAGARDLQEVIRGFLRWAHEHWGVAWVLLGGDIAILPMRRVPGASEGHIAVEATNPPDKNRSYWASGYLKMHVDRPGVWFPANVAGLTLVRPDTGLAIPYDATGTATMGWHFTTDDGYNSLSATPTKYVRVNGGAAQINAKLQWIYNWNHIPTDLYYASLIGPHYGQSGTHDWDLTGNGLYGQHTNDADLDGMEFRADVSVGRAPVSSAAQASGFVDKVIAYESFRQPNGSLLDSSWTRKLLMVSSNWGGRRWVGPAATTPPGDWQYHHGAGDAHSLIHLKEAFETLEWRLLAQVSPTDVRILPYNRSAGPGARGWKYTISGTNLSTSEVAISIFGMTFHIPIPTPWVVVYGSAAELQPSGFIFDHTNADGSLRDQEELRQQIAADLPAINDVSRLYEDEIDLTPTQVSAGPVSHLTDDRLRDALNDGQHFVSLSGHGNSGGCCGLSVGMADNLNNGMETFIGYADSCLTNQFDTEDAVSEHLLYNPTGGAVAYVGNARFSWIGVGDNFQRRFFERLTTTRHLGLLNDTRCSMVNEATGFWRLYNKWAIFSLNLMGDPEMPVWSNPPRHMTVQMPHDLDRRIPFVVTVRTPFFGLNLPLAGAVVTIEQGAFRQTAITNSTGMAHFDVAGTVLGLMEVTVTHIGYLPVFDSVDVVGPAWVTGNVRVVAHQHPNTHRTFVELDLDPPVDGDERRGWIARDDRADYRIILDAVTDAYISGEKISLYVASIKEDGIIERFRFGPFPTLIAAVDLRRERMAIPDWFKVTEDLVKADAAGVRPAAVSETGERVSVGMVDLRDKEEEPTVTPMAPA